MVPEQVRYLAGLGEETEYRRSRVATFRCDGLSLSRVVVANHRLPSRPDRLMTEQAADRPLRRRSLTELKSIADSNADPGQLREVEHELRFRSTQHAATLLVDVRARLNAAATGDDGASGRQKPPSEGQRAGSRTMETDVLEPAYHMLRQLITDEAELLARWGLAPGLPGQLEVRFLDIWEGILQEPGAHGGRSLGLLRDTRARLAALRARSGVGVKDSEETSRE